MCVDREGLVMSVTALLEKRLVRQYFRNSQDPSPLVQRP